MNKKQRKMLIRIIAAAALMIGLSFLPVEGWLRFLLYLVPYFISAMIFFGRPLKESETGSLLTKVF